MNGGSYTVAKENLGVWPGLVAAAALMVDYLLNVAVGISAGVAALVSAIPALYPYILPLCLGMLAVISLLNLRGTGEAGLVFGIPTYMLIASLGATLVYGVFKAMGAGGHPEPVAAPPALPGASEQVGAWILMRAFASGCTAMTGVEAVSNGVSAFAPPTVERAHRTLTVIVLVLALFLGSIGYLAHAYSVGAMPQEQAGYQSVLSQLTAAIVGRGWLYYITIGSILTTLCLSANTSFVDFPRLSRLIAEDGFLPKSFTVAGRRLVYSMGIVVLSGLAAVLLVAFGGITDRLIPLFAVGAFLAFTLSQAGMVNHWRKELRRLAASPRGARGRHRIRIRMWVNLIGAIATGTALAVIVAAKFTEGAWITVIALPALIAVFWRVHRYYAALDHQTITRSPLRLNYNPRPVVVVPVKQWDKITEKALRFALWLSNDVIAIHLNNLTGDEAQEDDRGTRELWRRDIEEPAQRHGVAPPRLIIAQTPYRRFLRPLLGEIDHLKMEYPDRLIAVVVPEVIETRCGSFFCTGARRPSSVRRCFIARSTAWSSWTFPGISKTERSPSMSKAGARAACEVDVGSACLLAV